MSRTDPLRLAVRRISRDAPSEHVRTGGVKRRTCVHIPCGGFYRYSSPTWRVPRLLPWALRPS